MADDVAHQVIKGTAGDEVEGLQAWDGDSDGIVDLIVRESLRVVRFASPWDGDRSLGAPHGAWTLAACAEWSCDLGYATSTGGDLDGDGVPDLVLGADDQDVQKKARAGAAYVVRNADLDGGELTTYPMRVEGDQAGGQLGTAAAVADVDGDGADDLVLGSYQYNAGKAGRSSRSRPPRRWAADPGGRRCGRPRGEERRPVRRGRRHPRPRPGRPSGSGGVFRDQRRDARAPGAAQVVDLFPDC